VFRGILAWAGLGAFCFFAERVRIFLFVVLEIGAIPGGNCPSEVNAPPVRIMPHVADQGGHEVLVGEVFVCWRFGITGLLPEVIEDARR
jgi:hypothetical protein